MQTVTTLQQVTARGYLLADDPAPIADAYRKHCQRRRLPVVTVQPDGKAWLVQVDMATTGRTLNVVGNQVLAQLAAQLGSQAPTTDNALRAYSLPTAERVAKRLRSIGADRRFWAR